MPYLKKLFQLCVQIVVSKLQQIRRYYHSKNVSFTELYEGLAPKICEYIINKGFSSDMICTDLDQLLKTGVKTLRTTRLIKEHFEMNNFKIYLKSIEVINLKYCKLMPESLCTIFQNTKMVKFVNLGHTCCDDEVLKTISDNCHLLIYINLNGTEVTDRGIEYLCYNPLTLQPQCPSLQKIKICSNETSYRSILSLMIFHQSLREIYTFHDLTDKLLEQYNTRSGKPLQITRFSNTFHFADISNIAECIPYLENIAPCTRNDLLKLTDDTELLAKLNSITLWIGVNKDIGFQDLLHFATKRGEYLTDLQVHGIQNIDISSIGHLCPNLQILHISASDCLAFNINLNTPHFTKLQQLKISHIINEFWEKWLRNLLICSSGLQCLQLKYLEKISNKEIRWMVRNICLVNLNKITLDICWNVTVLCLWELVKSSFPLSIIKYGRPLHEEINIEHELNISEYIRRNNLDLEIDFF